MANVSRPQMVRSPYEDDSEFFNLTTSSQTIIASGKDTKKRISEDSTMVNYSASAAQVEFHLVGSGDSVADTRICGIFDLAADETITIPKWLIKSRWALKAKCSVNTAVNLFIRWEVESIT